MSIWKLGHIIQGGKYVIEKVLGAGGAGITYRAKELATGKIVAIKTLNATIQAQPDFNLHQQRFVQEAFRLAKCNHSHVIRVDDVCQEDELWCMIMEYIEGGNLESLVKTKHGLSEAEAIKYIYQVGNALAYIHEKGILHRDVKPANIMRRPEKDEAVLIDFGLARDFIQDKTQIQTNSRTEGFAPLEQYVRRAKRGAYTDVYALAATLYYFLTVKIPFPAQFRAEGMNLVSPQQHNPQISDQINEAILKGMELKPENRPQSMLEWLNLLISKTEIEPSLTSDNNPIILTPLVNDQHMAKKGKPSPPLPIPPLPPARIQRKAVHRNTPNKPSYDPLSESRFTKNVGFQNVEVSEPSFYFEEEEDTFKQEITIPQASVIQPPEFSSAVGIDYTNLKELLSAGKWQEADEHTTDLMLKIVNKDNWIDKNTMKNFPCEDLQSIDKLWVKYSKGRFGFSVQKRIYQSLGGKREYDKKVWEDTADKLGWRVNKNWLFKEDLAFNLTAPLGHLPSLALSGILDRGIYTLISRCMDCTL